MPHIPIINTHNLFRISSDKTTFGYFKSVIGFSPQTCLHAITSADREVNLWLLLVYSTLIS